MLAVASHDVCNQPLVLMIRQKMKLEQQIILLLILVLNSGCFTYRSFVPLDLKEVNLEVPIKITYVLIEDNRIEISKEDDIKIPFVSGLKGKTWKHHPKMSPEYKQLIEKTIEQNFQSNAFDTASIFISVNYACKEFEQTGISEIERVYLNTDTKLKSKNYEYFSSAIDTFHYESMDASNKHFENFFQTSLQNNIVRNISVLRNQYYNSEQKEIECFDQSHSKINELTNKMTVEITGKEQIESFEIEGELRTVVSQEWNFKISTNQEGKLSYIELLDEIYDKGDELKAVMKYLENLKVAEVGLSSSEPGNCRKLSIRNTITNRVP